MKPFLVWCAVFFVLYTGCSLAYHTYLTQAPRQVLVAVDTSFPMQAVWDQVPEVLATIQQRRYTLFSLITDKGHLHSWQPGLRLGAIRPYAPRDLTALVDPAQTPEIEAADTIYLITNAAHLPTLPQAQRWHVVHLRSEQP
jgi:hypothetical protein